MALVLPIRGQADWDITNNNALTYLESAIDDASSTIDGVIVSGTPNVNDVLTATSSSAAHWAPGGTTTGTLLAVNNLNDVQSAAAARSNLGLGTAATASSSAFDASGAANTAQTNSEAYTDAQIISEITRANTSYPLKANNLSDLANITTARANLGLGNSATLNVGTGASTVAAGNDSRIVNAAPLASPTFTGTPAAPTATAGTSTTQLATTAFVANAVSSLSGRVDVFDVTKSPYNAKGDGKFILDGAITSGAAILTSASNPFAAGDVGKYVMIKGAAPTGVTSLIATITTFTSAGQVTISTNASITVTGALVLWATDDTAAIQSAINAAAAYAALHGAGTVFFPTGAGYYYGIAGALVTGGSTHGNSQLTIPIVATTNNKSGLTFLGAGNGSILQHWQQLTPQFSGSTLVSFGVFASSGAQSTSVNNNGNPCVIGGPAQPGGYGVAPGVYSNMGVTFQNMSILTTYSLNGLTYTAGDMSGMSNCNLFDFAYGTTGTVPHNDFQGVSSFANGLSIGWLMPANGNNDNCAVRNVTCHGGYTFGFYATEHTSVDAMRILYCWSGFCPVGVYFSSVGATHAFWVNQLSVEACSILVNIVGAGSAGIGPFIQIDQLDTETSSPVFADRNSGVALAAALGTIRLTGLYTAANITTGGLPTGLKIIDGQKAYPVTSVSANYAVLVSDDTILVNATTGPIDITLISAAWTPNTYTIKKTDSSANSVTVHTVNSETIQGTGAPAATYSLPIQGSTVNLYPARVSSAWNWYTK